MRRGNMIKFKNIFGGGYFYFGYVTPQEKLKTKYKHANAFYFYNIFIVALNFCFLFL